MNLAVFLMLGTVVLPVALNELYEKVKGPVYDD